MADRDDVNLRQFKSRAANKKVVEKPVNPQAPPSMNIFVMVDGMHSDAVDLCGWTRVGTSPRITPADVCRSRRRVQMYMNDA